MLVIQVNEIYYTHALVNRSLIKRHFQVILFLLLYEPLDL